MVRARSAAAGLGLCVVVAGLGLGIGAGGSGCSLILDFSPSAIPVDAEIDAAYSQEECDYREPNNAPAEAMPFAASESSTGDTAPKSASPVLRP